MVSSLEEVPLLHRRENQRIGAACKDASPRRSLARSVAINLPLCLFRCLERWLSLDAESIATPRRGGTGLTSSSRRTETAYGVDGCRKGWFYFALVPGREPEWAVVEKIADLVAGANDSDRIFIDIPIGLPNGGEGRLCDSAARRKLAPHRTSSVFPVPVRSALTAETYEEANEQNRKASGKGLPKQTYAIMPKIREVDSLLRGSARARSAVREVHPEICFWALAGGSPMRHGKKTGRGFHERLTLLERFHTSAVKCFDEIRTGYRRRDLADDDILDAMAVAITASADRGALRTLPELPVEDSCGLPMEMVYAPASAFARSP